MHNDLWNMILDLDFSEICTRAQAAPTGRAREIEITMINCPYRADLDRREVYRCRAHDEPVPAGYLEQLCVLSYLINAKERPLSGKLVKPEQLDAGQFFFRGPHGLPLEPLERSFGKAPRQLMQAARKLGARPRTFGDASVEISLFARVPVTLIVWAEDDEFSARASVLFDETAADQLPLDALLVAVNLAVSSITDRP